MADLTDQQAHDYLIKLLSAMSKAGGSDLFIASDFPPSMKSQGEMQPMTTQKLTGEVTRQLAHSLMNEVQRAEFAKEMECNFAVSVPGVSRFRVNVFVQQQNVGMVIRTIAAEIPNFEKLMLPEILKEVIMNKRGLVLVELEEERTKELAAQEEKKRVVEADKLIKLEQEARQLENAQMEIPPKLIMAQETLQITPFPTTLSPVLPSTLVVKVPARLA